MRTRGLQFYVHSLEEKMRISVDRVYQLQFLKTEISSLLLCLCRPSLSADWTFQVLN
jgi:hypothetical protein